MLKQTVQPASVFTNFKEAVQFIQSQLIKKEEFHELALKQFISNNYATMRVQDTINKVLLNYRVFLYHDENVTSNYCIFFSDVQLKEFVECQYRLCGLDVPNEIHFMSVFHKKALSHHSFSDIQVFYDSWYAAFITRTFTYQEVF